MPVSIALPQSLPVIWKNFLVLGQSNAQGRGFLTDLVGTEFPNKGRIRVRRNNVWVQPGSEPTDDPAEGSGVGFGMAFANSLAGMLPNTGIGIINGAYGGSSIAQWQKSSLLSSWYGRALNRARIILNEGGTIDGMCFYQGETEAMTSLIAAQSWDENFLQFCSDFRTDLGINIPIVFSTLCANPSLAETPYWNDVLASQNGITLTGLNMARVSAVGLTVRTDLPEQKVHLATAGQLALGPMLATAMDSLL